MNDVVELMEANIETFSNEFLVWLPNNLHIWDAFVEQAMAVRSRGFKRYSTKTIIHVLRHHSALHEEGGEWKINNNISPYLARLFDLKYPAMAGMWELRATHRARRDNHLE
jgi:hypothetical protein